MRRWMRQRAGFETAAGLEGTVALTLLTISIAVSLPAHAQDKTLYIGMNGGDMERSYSKYVFPAFEKIHGVKVVVVPGTSSDILAKVQASKEKPPVHVMFLDDGVGISLAQPPNA